MHIKLLTARMRAASIVCSLFLLIGAKAFTPLLSSNVVLRSSLVPPSSPSGLFNRVPTTKYIRDKTELNAFLLNFFPNRGSFIIAKLMPSIKKGFSGFIVKLLRIVTSPFFVALSYIITTFTKKVTSTASKGGSKINKTAIASSELLETTSRVERIVIQIDKDKEEKALKLFLEKKEKAEKAAAISIEAERFAAIDLAKTLGYVSRTSPSEVQFDSSFFDSKVKFTISNFFEMAQTDTTEPMFKVSNSELVSTLTALMVTVLAIGAAR